MFPSFNLCVAQAQENDDSHRQNVHFVQIFKFSMNNAALKWPNLVTRQKTFQFTCASEQDSGVNMRSSFWPLIKMKSRPNPLTSATPCSKAVQSFSLAFLESKHTISVFLWGKACETLFCQSFVVSHATGSCHCGKAWVVHVHMEKFEVFLWQLQPLQQRQIWLTWSHRTKECRWCQGILVWLQVFSVGRRSLNSKGTCSMHQQRLDNMWSWCEVQSA